MQRTREVRLPRPHRERERERVKGRKGGRKGERGGERERERERERGRGRGREREREVGGVGCGFDPLSFENSFHHFGLNASIIRPSWPGPDDVS